MGLGAVQATAATETLFTNWTYAVSRGDEPGKLWVYSEGDAGSGISYLTISVDGHGTARADSSYQEMISDSLAAVQNGFTTDELAELRRVPYVTTENLGLVLPMLGVNSKGEYATPKGYFVDEAEAEEFDKAFPPLEKLKLPGQLV